MINSEPSKAPVRRPTLRSQVAPVKLQPRQNKFNMTKVMDNIFESIVNDYINGDAKEVPIRFYEFYSTQMMRTFLITTISYFYTYVSAMDYARKQKKEEYKTARKLQLKRLRTFGELYAAILLNCSLFENSKEDELFFECLYHFTFLLLQQCLDPTPYRPNLFWERIKHELNYLFRSETFNYQSTPSDSKSENGGSGTKRYSSSDGSGEALAHNRPTIQDETSEVSKDGDIDIRSTHAGGTTISAKGSSTDGVDLPPMSLVSSYALLNSGSPGISTSINSIKNQRFAKIPELKQAMCTEPGSGKLQPQERGAEGNATVLPRKITRPEGVFAPSASLGTQAQSPRRKKFSVHQALGARSPLVSHLFPTPKEKIDKLLQSRRV